MTTDGPVTALLLGGGAPTLTLQSGALAALHEHGVEFDVISAAGAGMLIGLLYIAPRGVSSAEALAQTRQLGVHDSIYHHFPVSFKVFHKPGELADGYPPLVAVAAPYGTRSGRCEPAVDRLAGADARHHVPLGSVAPQPGSLRPCPMD